MKLLVEEEKKRKSRIKCAECKHHEMLCEGNHWCNKYWTHLRSWIKTNGIVIARHTKCVKYGGGEA